MENIRLSFFQLRNLARAQRASGRTQERETSLTSTESDSDQDDEPLKENDKVDAACQSDATGNYVLIITFNICCCSNPNPK